MEAGKITPTGVDLKPVRSSLLVVAPSAMVRDRDKYRVPRLMVNSLKNEDQNRENTTPYHFTDME
jgi:hypothetical protein